MLFVEGRNWPELTTWLVGVEWNVSVENIYWIFQSLLLCSFLALTQDFELGRVILIIYVQLLCASSQEAEELKNESHQWENEDKLQKVQALV